MATSSDTNTITIDLDATSRNPVIWDATQLLQRHIFEKLTELVGVDLDAARKARDPARQGGNRCSEDSSYPAGSGLTYFIDGTRGAGKSTFLQYAYRNLNPQSVTVRPLQFLDPSRIERSEILLLHVLKALNRAVDAQTANSSSREEKVHGFREAVKRMAGGLHLFVSSNESLKDLDPELFLDYGLERAADSQGLRADLHDTIDKACELLNVDALILAVDDADTKASHAMDVLECIRKYLDTPKLVVLVTGDMEMYSLLVQEHFHKDMGRSRGELNSDRKAQQLRMVDHMEEQYLLKLFPVNRRVQLRTLWDLTADGGCYEYRIRGQGGDGDSLVRDIVGELARQGMRLKAARDIKLFEEYLLKLPVRSVLQVLSRAIGSSASRMDINECSEALRAIALSSLYQHGVDVDAITASELHPLTEAVFDLTLRDGDPDTGAYLRPQPREATLRNSFVSMSADVVRLCATSPEKAVTYLLAGPGSVSVYFQVARKIGASASEAKEDRELIKLFKQYLSVGRKEDALNWAWRATAALINTTNSQRVIRHGIIGLIGRVRADRHGETEIAIRKAIRDALAQNDKYPAIAFSLCDVAYQNGVRTYASIFNVLGLMARLLALDSQTPKKELQQLVEAELRRVVGVATISPPSWSGADASEKEVENESAALQSGLEQSEEDLEDSKLPDNEAKQLSVLSTSVTSWLIDTRDLRGQIKPSAVMLGKIWTRLFFSLTQAAEAIRPISKQGNCAQAMELFAWCVINAFLVEEADHHAFSPTEKPAAQKTSSIINRRNPLSSPSVVAEKFKDQKIVNDKQLPLTFLIAKSPLLLGLLEAKKRSTKDLFTALFGSDSSKASPCEEETWEFIKRSAVARSGTSGKG